MDGWISRWSDNLGYVLRGYSEGESWLSHSVPENHCLKVKRGQMEDKRSGDENRGIIKTFNCASPLAQEELDWCLSTVMKWGLLSEEIYVVLLHKP